MFNEYPYRNLTDLNLDYILNAIKTFQNDVTNFVSINAIKYANPIQWNITSQYEKNTIVIDPLSGTAYISVAPVPSGVALTREDYWTVVFDLSLFIVRAAKNFTNRYEAETTTTATFTTPAGGWLVWGDTLYVANVNITAGDSYVPDSNITHITMEEVKNAVYQFINDNYDAILDKIGSLEDLTTTDKSNIVAAINEVISSIGSLDDLSTTDKTNIVAAINEVISSIGSLDDLTTTDKTNIVAAINEVNNTAIQNDRFIAISNLPDATPATIQNAINQYSIIDFDIDVNLGSASLNIPSDTEIYSSNNSVIYGSSCVFKLEGSISETEDASLTFTDRNNGTFVGSIEDSREYLVKSDFNSIGGDALSLGYPDYMGGGTTNSSFAYPTIYTNIKISGSNFQTNIPTYGKFTTGKAYKYNAVTNCYIHDLNVDCSANNDALALENMPITTHYASNCQFKNIRIMVGYGRCFQIVASHSIVIDDCSATALNSAFRDHYHNNVFGLVGCYNCEIINCSGVGSQPFDITYNQANPYCSAYCKIENCTAYANYSCLTTHPGTWCCLISRLTGYTFGSSGADGIGIRGSLHTIKDCIIIGQNEAGTFAFGITDGCSCHKFYNNEARNFQYGFYMHETATHPWSAYGRPFVEVHDNIFTSCGIPLRIHREVISGSTISLNFDFKNNTFVNDNNALSNDALLVIDGSGDTTIQLINISIKLFSKTATYAIKNDSSATLRRVMMEVYGIQSSKLDNSYSGNVIQSSLSIKGGNITTITTTGTQLPPFTEYNT